MYFNLKKIPYVIVPKAYLKDKTLTLKAKGLLTIMFSLPDDWDYSLNGLISITGAGEKQTSNILKELEEKFYLWKTQKRNKKGQFEYEYTIFEEPTKPYPLFGGVDK